MSLKPKPQSSEFDHIRDTLTDLIESVGEGNSTIKQVQEHLLKHDNRFDQQDKEIAEIKEMLQALLSR